MLGIRHTGIYANDLEIMKDFYCNELGLDVVVHNVEKSSYIDTILCLKNAEIELYKLKTEDGSMIELLKYKGYQKPPVKSEIWELGRMHIAITVRNIDEKYTMLSNAGIAFLSSPQLSPDGYAKVCFCQDPEGNYIELVEVL